MQELLTRLGACLRLGLHGRLGACLRYRPEVMGFRIVPASAEMLRDIQALESRAAARFRGGPHAIIADSPPLGLRELQLIGAAGGLWAVTSRAGDLAAYIAWEPMDQDAYVVALLASRQGLSRLVLRTFSDVPWNAPYYRELGFQELAHVPAALEEAPLHEAAIGLDLSRRVTMARPIA